MVRIRFRRVGSRNQATFRIVAAEKEAPRDGRFLEILGHYNPRTEPATITVDETRLFHWLKNGAQPSESVMQALKSVGTWDRWERYKAGEDLEKLLKEKEEAVTEIDPRTRRDDLVKDRKKKSKKSKKAEEAAAEQEKPAAEPAEPEQEEPAVEDAEEESAPAEMAADTVEETPVEEPAEEPTPEVDVEPAEESADTSEGEAPEEEATEEQAAEEQSAEEEVEEPEQAEEAPAEDEGEPSES